MALPDPANPAKPSHPPIHTSHHHLTFRPVTLIPKDQVLGDHYATGRGAGESSSAFQGARQKGRPKGISIRPKIVVQSEAEARELDVGSMPDNISSEYPAHSLMLQREAES